jgi:hypothetical protein
MPLFSTSSLISISVVVGIGALLYSETITYSDLIPGFITNTLVWKIIQNIFSDTYCYRSVTTLSSGLPHAECFSVSNGKFSRVFLDDTSYPITKDARTGYVIPGLWDGHGHLLQYGELMNSVNLFGANSMDEVHKRLIAYKAVNPEAGTSDQWLRGVGWDQANFGGKWPTAVGLALLFSCLLSHC